MERERELSDSYHSNLTKLIKNYKDIESGWEFKG
jgi:hypothetical protein